MQDVHREEAPERRGHDQERGEPAPLALAPERHPYRPDDVEPIADAVLTALGSPPPGARELTPEFHGITEADLRRVPGSALGFPERATAADVVARLREVYASRFAFEVWHLQDAAEREWFRRMIESGGVRPASHYRS